MSDDAIGKTAETHRKLKKRKENWCALDGSWIYQLVLQMQGKNLFIDFRGMICSGKGGCKCGNWHVHQPQVLRETTFPMQITRQKTCVFSMDRQDLTRFAIQPKGPDGKWTRKPLAYRESKNVHLLITRPPKICVNLVFKHIHAEHQDAILGQRHRSI